MADNLKRYKKGEFLFKEGEVASSIFVIKSGRVLLQVERSGKKIEIETLSSSQIIGEQSLFGSGRQPFSAEAVSEVRLMEIPISLVKTQVESAPPGVKLMVKGLTDGMKTTRGNLRTVKMEQDNSPMPQMLIPKMFSILVLVASHIGKKPDEEMLVEEKPVEFVVDWKPFKIFVSRMFLESIPRMESVLKLLSKLEFVSLKYELNEDKEEELTEVYVHNLQTVEGFCEFYQYNLFKGGKAEPIYIDKLVMDATRAFNYAAKDLERDRQGAVQVAYDELLDVCKKIFRFDLKTTHFNAMEKKGLFVKRSTLKDDSAVISFDKEEYTSMYEFWRIILEIDKWNAAGEVDVNEVEEVVNEEGPASCPQCATEVEDNMNFCANCGFKLAA